MKIDIDEKAIKQWEKDSKQLEEDSKGKIKAEILTPKTLKEMVEEYLYDYFS